MAIETNGRSTWSPVSHTVASMRWVPVLLAALALGACSNDTSGLCGDGESPEVVTGLNGVLEGGGPALEVQYREPATCDVIDSHWIFFDDPTQRLSLGEEPTDGDLLRDRVQVEDREVYFTDFAVSARLSYPDDLIGPQLTVTWSTATGDALGEVTCVGADDVLTCTLTEP